MGKAALLIIALACCGCANKQGPLPSDPRSIWCDYNTPRRDAKSDTPRAELDEINKHNAMGEKWCGWTP